MAGDGDLKHLFQMIDQAQQTHCTAGKDQEKIALFYEQTSPLRPKVLTDAFDDSSLFQKVLQQTLTKEQRARYDRQERERGRFQFQAKVELFMSAFESEVVAISADQRRELMNLLLDESVAPKKYGEWDICAAIVQMAKLKDEKLKSLFDAAQQKAFKKMVAECKEAEPTMQGEGYLP